MDEHLRKIRERAAKYRRDIPLGGVHATYFGDYLADIEYLLSLLGEPADDRQQA